MEQLLLHTLESFWQKKMFVQVLNSFSLVANMDRSVKLLLVGGGPQESQLRDLLKKNNIQDRVILLGVRSDVHRILSGVDIFVHLSYTEGLSTALGSYGMWQINYL